jgi:membrane-associated protein
MDLVAFLIDFVLHVDVHLRGFVEAYGTWVYALLFLIIFVETGLVVMPFLPGDSLLFVAGTIAGVGGMSLPVLIVLLTVAAILGDALNYSVGRYFGPRVFAWEESRWFNRAAFDRTHAFYERHGAITIIVARFLPFVRTFAPFVAGIAEMTYAKFALYNVIGAVLWVVGLSTLGYLIGNTAFVKANFQWVTLAFIVIPGLPAVFEVLRHWWLARARRRAGTPAP